tara:strand:+ start:274 stop:561 length:288 start_codon:yes stop_codon:yes gene_type:complete
MKTTYQLYFGLNHPNGSITDDAWKSFEDVLSMSFAGYTIQDVQGSWKGKREPTKLVTVSTKYEEKVNDVCSAYVKIFNQDAVGMLRMQAMTFISK